MHAAAADDCEAKRQYVLHALTPSTNVNANRRQRAHVQLGMVGDMLQWIAKVDVGPDVSPHLAVAFVAVRVTCFRSIGLLDGLIFGGAFDTCVRRTGTGH